MRKALIFISLFITLAASAQQMDTLVTATGDSLVVMKGRMVPVTGAFLQPLQERDSVLVADQLLYGFELKQVEEGTQFGFPQWENDPKGGVTALTSWMVDTLKVTKQKKGMPKLLDIKAGMVITSFDEGLYDLPQIAVQRLSNDGVLDTLVFDPMRLDVRTMPVDTATFQPHDIKDIIRYPITVAEVLPWVGALWLFGTLVTLAVCLIMMRRRRNDPDYVRRDPPHIVALRALDKYRGNAMWAPEKQKAFYTGITDALREYIAERYGVGAMEMTTAEIFDNMKATDAPEDLLAEIRDLFERADFVKFAKFTASDEDNASALPVAVRFVTSTYPADLEVAAAQDDKIDEIKVVTPEAMGDLSIVENEDYVTLVTCTPYGINSHRLLVRGSRI